MRGQLRCTSALPNFADYLFGECMLAKSNQRADAERNCTSDKPNHDDNTGCTSHRQFDHAVDNHRSGRSKRQRGCRGGNASYRHRWLYHAALRRIS